ncbi:SSI family serine proteinase inhibitor [Streptomyces yaanensis]|uniref:SSI family serine proteinase inhibitor n=1 Tax=Streptomyces yaanensis TaxID=1142239 RepID=A0ABV7SCH3_9ACTN|nr:SSI family serine proteinase inhibitor [Streptomyces sp. CGMCC 4.7035]WNB98525.1 SSI family serine proteinase inhibitor [Streptomyces sp. CGMCC 4.7035]
MTKTTLALRGVLLAAAALLTATPAQAAPGPAVPGNWLYLTVTKGDDRSRDIHGTLLMCNPPQGHLQAVRACAELAAVEGDIGRMPPRDTFCPMIYAPVTVSARGEWSGRQVDYSHTFVNMCDLAARTGAVFALPDQGPNRPVAGMRN